MSSRLDSHQFNYDDEEPVNLGRAGVIILACTMLSLACVAGYLAYIAVMPH